MEAADAVDQIITRVNARESSRIQPGLSPKQLAGVHVPSAGMERWPVTHGRAEAYHWQAPAQYAPSPWVLHTNGCRHLFLSVKAGWHGFSSSPQNINGVIYDGSVVTLARRVPDARPRLAGYRPS